MFAKCLTKLEETDSGEIYFEGSNLVVMKQHERRRIRPQLQLIFQDAATAFNPRFSAAEIFAEPLVIPRRGSDEQRKKRALELMEQTALPVDAAARSASDFNARDAQGSATSHRHAHRDACLSSLS